MEKHRRATDGRRLFTAEFKREQVARIEREDVTLAELARDLSISPSVVRRWHRLSTAGSAAAVGANEDVVPASELRLALMRVKDLERALGKKVMEIEILQAARDAVKKSPRSYGVSKR
ncbi:MAG: transposase [Gemmatimonadaceae bacterium]